MSPEFEREKNYTILHLILAVFVGLIVMFLEFDISIRKDPFNIAQSYAYLGFVVTFIVLRYGKRAIRWLFFKPQKF